MNMLSAFLDWILVVGHVRKLLQLMNMFSVILNLILAIDHVKGLLHYAMGDTQRGNHVMCASTRSFVVAAAGAAGMASGPVEAAILGALAGTLWDKIMATDIRAGVVASDALAGMVRGTLWSWPWVGGYVTLLSVAVFVNAVARKESFRRAHRISRIVIDRLRSRDQGQDEDSKTSTPLPDGRSLTEEVTLNISRKDTET